MTMTKRARRLTRRTSLTSIAQMGRLFRQDKLPAQDRGPLVVAAREPERTGTAGAGVAEDADPAVVAVAAAGKRAKPH
jgi:hypothetical protein